MAGLLDSLRMRTQLTKIFVNFVSFCGEIYMLWFNDLRKDEIKESNEGR